MLYQPLKRTWYDWNPSVLTLDDEVLHLSVTVVVILLIAFFTR